MCLLLSCTTTSYKKTIVKEWKCYRLRCFLNTMFQALTEIFELVSKLKLPLFQASPPHYPIGYVCSSGPFVKMLTSSASLLDLYIFGVQITNNSPGWATEEAFQQVDPFNYMTPCDSYLFPELKRPLKGKRFQTREDIRTATTAEMKIPWEH